jgi:DNA-directed RNA polymerase subunit beta
MAADETRRVSPARVNGAGRQRLGRRNEVVPMPDLNDIQRESFNLFLKEGLTEVFAEIPTIQPD